LQSVETKKAVKGMNLETSL